MQRWFWGRWLLFVTFMLLVLTNCQPAAAPASRPSPGQIPPSPTPTVVFQSPISPAPTTAAAAAQSTSGMRITASIGPTCPGPSRPGQACERPYAGEFVITTNAGAEAARVTTADNGQATVDLPPGVYMVQPKLDSKVPFPRSASVKVTVPPGQYVDVTIQLDTGMR